MSRVVPLRPEPAPAAPAHVEIISVNVIQRDGLLAHVHARFGALIVRQCPVLTGNTGPWVGLPSKPVIGGDGRVAKDEHGKTRYGSILEFTDRETANKFSAAILGALRASHPGVLEGGVA